MLLWCKQIMIEFKIIMQNQCISPLNRYFFLLKTVDAFFIYTFAAIILKNNNGDYSLFN